MYMALTSIFLYIVIIIWVIYRQLQPKKIKQSQKKLLVLILLGLYFLLNNIDEHKIHLNLPTILGLTFSLIVLAVGFGALRALTCKVWQTKGIYYRKATWLTILLWIIMIFLHGTIDYLTKTGSSSLFLYLALTLYSQHFVLLVRTRSL